jgi:gas vesicle protein
MNERTGQTGNGNVNGMAMGFLCGALIGAGVALLMAPSSGAETRRRLGETARRLKRDVPNKARGLADQARSTLGAVKEGIQQGVQEGRSAFQRDQESQTIYSDRPGA